MITQITTVDELKQIFLEIFLNKTDKVSDVSNESVLNGIAYGVSKLSQRLLVNQAVVEAHLFPDTAYGEYLDKIAELRGIASRFGSCGSSTYVRVEATPGTTYSASVVKFNSTNGITFIPDYDYTVDNNGYGYIKVHSEQTGKTSNVDALTINNVTNAPTGHSACTNEYRASGGIDEEDDELFRKRIKESVNQLSRNTISYLEQIFMKINPKVLKIYKGGTDGDGKLCLIVVSVNGSDFSEQEFNEILSRSEEFLSLNEILKVNSGFAIKLLNVNWLTVNVDFRVDIDPSYDVDTVRTNIQVAISKLFDYRLWSDGEKVEWENILYAVKNIEGVRYVPDAHFKPQADIIVPKYRLPRIKSFIMRDLDGNVIADNYNVLANFYYPNKADINFQTSVISSI
jgi:uncharacterized phage protein gp47/JayE